jgi:hypothetical protein
MMPLPLRMLTRRVPALALAAACLAAPTVAFAGGRICTGADTFLFGNRAVGSSTTQSATVSNCGDDAWEFTDVSVHPATGPGYVVDTTCATGRMLAPGERCAVNVTFAPRVPGETSGALWLRNSTSTPDQLITFYGRGTDAQAGSAAIAFAPGLADFGAQPVGTQAGPLMVSVRNVGSAAFTPTALVINGPAGADFHAWSTSDAGDCAVGLAVEPGQSCRMNFWFRPLQTGVRNARLVIDAPQLSTLAILSLAGRGVDA